MARNDWVPGVGMTFNQILEAFRVAVEGKDVKDKMYWTVKYMIDTFVEGGNANFEVKLARGPYKDLASRLDASDQKVDSNTAQLADKINNSSNVITMDHLSQAVKTAMTGGSVAVVGEGAVGMINLNADLQTLLNDWQSLLTEENEIWEVV